MNPSRMRIPCGGVLFREGERPGTAYLIEAGEMEVRVRQGGADIVLSRLGPGDLVGEMAVIDDSVRTATATAVTDCVLYRLDRQQIAERLSAADPIIRSLLEGQLKRYRGALAALQGKPVMADRETPSEIAGIDKDLDITRKKLGNADFVARAKPEVVEENRQRLTDGEVARAKLEAALERLKAAT